MRNTGLIAMVAAAGMLALGGCGKPAADTDAIDRELVGKAGNETDPALTAALADQIMVDPALTQQSGATSARGPVGPARAPVPVLPPADPGRAPGTAAAPPPRALPGQPREMTLGELAAEQARRPAPAQGQGCERNLSYSTRWAARLPAAIPLFPKAQVSEAAGNELPGCQFRVVSFTTGAAVSDVIDWYYTRVSRAGFSAEHQARGGEHILAGTREADGSAFYLTATGRADGATDVDLVANNGR
jgi:hypothetical protein